MTMSQIFNDGLFSIKFVAVDFALSNLSTFARYCLIVYTSPVNFSLIFRNAVSTFWSLMNLAFYIDTIFENNVAYVATF